MQNARSQPNNAVKLTERRHFDSIAVSTDLKVRTKHPLKIDTVYYSVLIMV